MFNGTCNGVEEYFTNKSSQKLITQICIAQGNKN